MADLASIVSALASKLDDIQSDIYRRRDERRREETPPRSRGPRRQSYTVGGPLVSENMEDEDNAAPLATSATILHVQKPVPDGMIIKGISLKALRKLVEFKKLFAHLPQELKCSSTRVQRKRPTPTPHASPFSTMANARGTVDVTTRLRRCLTCGTDSSRSLPIRSGLNLFGSKVK